MYTTNAYIKQLDDVESEPFIQGLSLSISAIRIWYKNFGVTWQYLKNVTSFRVTAISITHENIRKPQVFYRKRPVT